MLAGSSADKKGWRTILTLGFSALGILYFLTQVLVLGVLWGSSFFDNQLDSFSRLSISLLIWSSILSGLLLLPLFLLSLYQVRGKSIPTWLDTDHPNVRRWVMWAILIWPLFVFLGWLIAGQPNLAVFLLGPINLVTAGLPVLWIYNAGRWKLKGGNQLRHWRIFGFSLTLLPVIVILIVFFVLIFLGVIFGLLLVYWVSVAPQIQDDLNFVLLQIQTLGQDFDKIFELLKPYILQPAVIVWIVVIFGGVMPIIEELTKPLALWALAGRKITPQEGFIGGLLCGAGFALMENVLYFSTAVNQEEWIFVAIGRVGTGILHIFASGLFGLGLAKAWRSSHWGSLIWVTLGSFSLHALWNTAALIMGFVPLLFDKPELSFWQNVLLISPQALLFSLSIIGLFVVNRSLRNRDQT